MWPSFLVRNFMEGKRFCCRPRIKLQDVVSSGAVSCESHWFLFLSRVQFRVSEREEVKAGWPWGKPPTPLQLALPCVMLPANGFCGQDSQPDRTGTEAEPLRHSIHPRRYPAVIVLCHINPLRLLIMILIYQLHLWLSSLYISVCSLKSLWWESCLVILFFSLTLYIGEIGQVGEAKYHNTNHLLVGE